MVFFILLGFMDVLVGALMLATHYGIIHNWRFALMGAVYLMGKSIIMRGSFLSVLDFAAGVYLLLIMLGVHSVLVWFFFVLMIYKFVTSLIMRG